MALFLLLTPGHGRAEGRLEWFDLPLLPETIRNDLVASKQLACGSIATSSLALPIPEDARLVFVSCHGGPYACPGRSTNGIRLTEQLTCPPNPTARHIATMHLVSRLRVPHLRAYYRRVLGDGFVALGNDRGSNLAFVEKGGSGTRRAWSPKRLHLAISQAKGPFRQARYLSQVRLTLSLIPPSEPRTRLRCRKPGLLERSDAERSDPLSVLCY